jgi:ethanolamine ammonia-lyase large subunit
MRLASTIRSVRYTFADVREVMAKANAPKSGDVLAGIAARDAVERVAARAVLAHLTLAEIRNNPDRTMRSGSNAPHSTWA